MKTTNSKTNWALALTVAATLASGFAMAEKGGGKGKDERADKGHGNSQGDKGHGNYASRHEGGEKASREGASVSISANATVSLSTNTTISSSAPGATL